MKADLMLKLRKVIKYPVRINKRMKKTNIMKILIFILIFTLASNIAYPFKANSSNYILSPLIISSGGDIVNSSSYKNYVATGIIAGIINSTSYINRLGFFYTWLLGDGQACTADNQCDGSFCCSNLCQSTSCPVEGTTTTTTGTGGAGAAAGGGGGGAGFVENKDFSLSKNTLKVELTLAEEKSETITVSNDGNVDLDLSLKLEGEISEYSTISDKTLSLEVEESKKVTLDILGKRVGVFAGQILVKEEEIEKSVSVSLEVESDISLFDVKLDIPKEYKNVRPDENLKTQITLLNIGAPELVDVIATYMIKDLRGNVVYQASETFAVEIQKSFERDFPISKNTPVGSYIAIIEIRYANSFAVSSDFFEVVEEFPEIEKQELRSKLVSTLIVVVLFAMVLLFTLKLIPKKRK